MAKRILGLDVGSHSVKVVELRQGLRGLEVAQVRALPLDAPGPALAEELREFTLAHNLSRDHVVCALPGDRISSRRLAFPFRDHRRIAQAVPFEVEGQVPFDLDQFFIDWEIVGGDRTRTDVVATLAPRSEVALLMDTLSAAWIEPRVVEAEGLVLANLCAFFELPGTHLLVDLGHRKTTLCLMVDERPVAARTIPVAGQALTAAVAKERQLGEGEAERIKLEEGVFGSGLDARSSEIHAVLDRLSRELVRTLGALEAVLAGTSGGRVDQITLLGGSARLHRVDEYLAERTGIPVQRLGAPAEPFRSAFVAGGDPMLFAPAAALALRGSGRGRTRMNFRQDEFARRVDLRQVGRELRWTGALAALALLLALGAAMTRIVVQNRQASIREAQSQALYMEAFPGQPLPSSVLSAMRESVRSTRNRADLLGVYRGNLSALDLLTEISARVPKELSVVFEELNIDPQVVRIRGHSDSYEDVERLELELSRFGPFSEIRKGETQSDARRGGYTFHVTISLGEPRETR
jgi:general secretion pathway protein L